MQQELHIDIETYSPEDLKKTGVYPYAAHPDFQILLFAYAFNEEPITVLDMVTGELLPARVLNALYDPAITKIAHNAMFERVCITSYIKKTYRNPKTLPIEQWECSMIKSAMLGLPLMLGKVAEVLGIPQQKMGIGMSLIRYFCMPCKPSAVNGGRTRNLPHHDPVKWNSFIQYCKADVAAERGILKHINYFEIPKLEKLLYILDQQINDRGVLIDREFVEKAINIDLITKERLSEEAIALTGVANPNSGAQMKAWLLAETGEDIASLTKASMPAILKRCPGELVAKVMGIKMELNKTSIKKYQAMINAVGVDSRIRGLSQFYGANRTGRWSGRFVQLQNLPQNHLLDLDLARKLVMSNDAELMEMFFGNVPDTLSQLIRTAFIAELGKIFYVADFSAIEARVAAFLADEKWRLEVFATHGKIYEASASQMFKVPIESVTKGSELRQKGKVSELACIAESQLILTNKGLVPIENITLAHKLWDGVEYVSHEGLLFKGYKNVITYEGLTATEDHLVWIEGESGPVQFGIAASSGSHLVQCRADGDCVWEGKNNVLGKKIYKEVESSNGTNRMLELSQCAVDLSGKPDAGEVNGVSEMLLSTADTEMVGQEIDSCKTTLRKSKGLPVSQLWRSWNQIQIRIGTFCGSIFNKEIWSSGSKSGSRSYKQQSTLLEGKHSFYCSLRESSEQANYRSERLGSNPVAIFEIGSDSEIILGDDQRAAVSRSEIGGNYEAKKLERHPEKVRVYDIRNAGPRNRFTVSGVLVHNCGYQGGVGALENMGALKMGIPQQDLQDLIDTWRAANPNIVRFWYKLNQAAMKVLEHGGIERVAHGVSFEYKNKNLYMHLPSGRSLCYVNPSIGLNRFEKATINYFGMDQMTKKWCKQETYGGKLFENLCQAFARDCLAVAMLRLDKKGYPIVFHVHDEVIIESWDLDPEDTLQDICRIMGEPISWAPGLLLKADGYVTKYYKKD